MVRYVRSLEKSGGLIPVQPDFVVDDGNNAGQVKYNRAWLLHSMQVITRDHA